MHLMLDIEALGKAPRGAVTEIGACFFDPADWRLGDSICINISLEANMELERVVDAATLRWWAGQPNFKETLPEDALEVYPALHALYLFVKEWKNLEGVWSNAPLYDFAMLRNLYEDIGVDVPWHYRQERCSRTFFQVTSAMVGADTIVLPERPTGKHRAEADAIYQAHVVCYLWDRLD